MAGEWAAGGFAKSGDNVHDALRNTGLNNELAETQRRQRSLFGRFDHHAITAGKRRSEFPSGHEQWEVPGYDLTDHAYRFPHGIGMEFCTSRVRHTDRDSGSF